MRNSKGGGQHHTKGDAALSPSRPTTDPLCTHLWWYHMQGENSPAAENALHPAVKPLQELRAGPRAVAKRRHKVRVPMSVSGGSGKKQCRRRLGVSLMRVIIVVRRPCVARVIGRACVVCVRAHACVCTRASGCAGYLVRKTMVCGGICTRAHVFVLICACVRVRGGRAGCDGVVGVYH